jgi:hypothetical protein
MDAAVATSMRSRALAALAAVRPPLAVIDDEEGLRPFETRSSRTARPPCSPCCRNPKARCARS